MRNMAARIARYCLVRFCQPRPTESIIIKNRSFTMSSIRMQMQSNSGAGGTGSNSSAASQNSNAKIDTAFLARQFINTLDANERKIIKDELIKAENEMQFQFGPGFTNRTTFPFLNIGTTKVCFFKFFSNNF